MYEITEKSGKLILYIESLDMKHITLLAQILKGRVTVNGAGKAHIAVKLLPDDNRLELLKKIIEIL